jgi:hypothetical protein
LLIKFALHAEYPGLASLIIRVHRFLLRHTYSIVFLLPFAMCAAFPHSDYYGSSALGVVRLRSSRLAWFLARQTIRVPVFRYSTLVPLDGELYPWRYWRRAKRAIPVSTTMPAVSSRDGTNPAASDRISSSAITPVEALWINIEASVAHFVVSS